MAPFLIALTIILSAAGYMATVPTVCLTMYDENNAPFVACFERVEER